MTQINSLTAQPIYWPLLKKRMLLGASIALIIIAIFLFGVNHPNPAWGKLWMIKPLIMVPLAGAAGGAFTYFVGYALNQTTGRKALAMILGLVGYIIALWLGTVLGLNGTLWN